MEIITQKHVISTLIMAGLTYTKAVIHLLVDFKVISMLFNEA